MTAAVAMLIFEASAQGKSSFNSSRRQDFYHQLRMGERVVLDVLARAGIEVDFCSASTAKEYKVVLVGIPAVSSVLAFYRAVAGYESWGRARSFRVIAGGPGVTNLTAVRQFIDLAVYGRAEGVIADLVAAAVDGKAEPGPHILDPSNPHAVSFAQVRTPYPHPIRHKGGEKTEGPIGCTRSCRYCQYRWTRRPSGHGDRYNVTIAGTNSVETTADENGNLDPATGLVTIAIDGSSERIRAAVRKPITADLWLDSFDQYTAKREAMGKSCLVTVYNVLGYPGETDADRAEFGATWTRAKRRSVRIAVEVRSFGFRAMPCTPMQWEAVDVDHDWHELLSGRRFVDEPGVFIVVGGYGTSSPRLLLNDMAILRAAPTAESDRLIRVIATSGKLRSLKGRAAMRALTQQFDLSPFIRRYSLDEPLPTFWLSGPTKLATLRKEASKLRLALQADAVAGPAHRDGNA